MARFSRIVLVVCVVCVAHVFAKIGLVMEKFDTWTDKDYVDFSYDIEKATSSFKCNLKVLKPLSDIDFHFESEIKSRSNAQHFFQNNATISLCDILALKNAHPMASMAFAALNHKGNLPDKCPIQSGTYTITHTWPSEDQLPSRVPELEMDLRWQLFDVEGGKKIMILNNNFIGHTTLNDSEKSLFSVFQG